MSCEPLVSGDTVIGYICGRRDNLIRRQVSFCPNCNRNRRFVIRWDGMWYGTTETCVACGDRWQDGEMAPRPFQRGWRQEAIAKARNDWATAVSPREWHKRTKAEVDDYFAASEAES